MYFTVIFPQILILSILVVVGVIGSKAGTISIDAKDMLAKIVFNITLPFMLFCNFSKLDITPRLLSNSLAIIVLTFITLLFMLLAGWLSTHLLRMTKGEAAIFKVHSVFGNLVYLGFPVISALYGEEGLLYAGMFQLVSNILMWTIGVIMLDQRKGLSPGTKLKHIFNPNTIAILIGFVMFLFSIKLPSVLMNSLGGLGDTTIYLSMLYIGSLMFYSNLRGFLNSRKVYILTLNKLVIIPVLILVIFAGAISLFPDRIDVKVISVLVIMSSMPAMANVVIMAKMFGADDKLATANVFVSTIASIVTLPLILLLLGIILR
jgi:malate permease and related proteins